MLDELDRELERRRHRFVRYADDCNIYVRSERAGQRVMDSITRFITTKAQAQGQRGKERGGTTAGAEFLGFSFTAGPEIKRMIAPKSLERFKQRIRDITRRAKAVQAASLNWIRSRLTPAREHARGPEIYHLRADVERALGPRPLVGMRTSSVLFSRGCGKVALVSSVA